MDTSNKKQKIFFLSFGAPSQNWHDAVNRICGQAFEFNIFEKIFGYTEKDLVNDEYFWNKHKNFIKQNKRLFGYGIWKPYLILKILDKINDNDILLYADAGCELNSNGKNYFLNVLIPKVNNKYIIGCETTEHTSHSNDQNYTKMDLIKYLDMEKSNKLHLNHIQSGCFMMKKCDIIVKMFEEYYNIACNYHLIDDTPSVLPNHSSFKEHRHDQSILSLLVKKYDLLNYDLYPTDWGHTVHAAQNYKKNAMDYPIWYCRNRTGISMKKFF